jgi:phage protein U
VSESFQHEAGRPSALLSDGILTVPIYGVTSMTLSESYHLPPIGSSGARAIVSTHDDTVSLAGLLVGPDRYKLKFQLESIADVARRGSTLALISQGRVTGLILVTAMTIRTDMQIEWLSFGASAGKPDVLDVWVSLRHMPLPGPLGKLLDVKRLGVSALTDWKS